MSSLINKIIIIIQYKNFLIKKYVNFYIFEWKFTNKTVKEI